MTFRVLVVAGLCAASISGCGDEEEKFELDESTCEAGLSYEAVGKPFVTKYCLSCHSEGASNRMSAPDDANFDTVAGIHEHGAHVGEEVAEAKMPPAAASLKPTAPERTDFLRWLECTGIATAEHDEH